MFTVSAFVAIERSKPTSCHRRHDIT